jgi:hypothetical protein
MNKLNIPNKIIPGENKGIEKTMKIRHFAILLAAILLLISCSGKSVSLSESEKLSIAKAALSELPSHNAPTQITRVAVSNVKYKVFDKIKRNINGVDITVLPMKISGNVLFEQDVIFSLTHRYLIGEATIHAYKNEVNDLKYEIIDSTATSIKNFDDSFPQNIRYSANTFVGKIKNMEKKPSLQDSLGGITIESNDKTTLVGCVPGAVADFINEKVNIGDIVKVYYYQNGCHACNFINVYEIDKIANN